MYGEGASVLVAFSPVPARVHNRLKQWQKSTILRRGTPNFRNVRLVYVIKSEKNELQPQSVFRRYYFSLDYYHAHRTPHTCQIHAVREERQTASKEIRR